MTCFLESCTESIKVPGLDAQSNRLVVEALFTTENRAYTVYLSRSTAFTNTSFPTEAGATVYIMDDQGNKIDFLEDEFELGTYFSAEIAAQPGRSYALHVITSDGTRYATTPETVPNAPAPIKNLGTVDGSDVDINGNVFEYAQVEVTFDDPANENNFYYWYWQASSVKEFGTPDINWQNATESDELFDGNETVYRFNSQYDKDFQEYVKVYQGAINEPAFIFLSNLRRQANSNQIPIFPPGQSLKSNLVRLDNPEEPVLGYFILAHVTSDIIQLTP